MGMAMETAQTALAGQKVYSCRLLQRDRVAHQTLAIRVERPSGFTFRPGQYVDLTIVNEADRDALGPVRSLSIASTPRDEYLEFVVRLRDTAFKRNLANLAIGSALFVEGPFDDLGFKQENNRELVFLAGGVGVGPFMSVLRTARATGTALTATLFYSNRRPEDAAYLAELWRMEKEISGFRLVATMTRMPESSQTWSGETGRLDLAFLKRYVRSWVGPAYYLVGSPGFISQLRSALFSVGVQDSDIGLEMYAGY